MKKMILALAGFLFICSAGHADEDSNEPATTKARHQMVQATIKDRGISDTRVLEAMQTVPRHRFVPDRLRSAAYADRP